MTAKRYATHIVHEVPVGSVVVMWLVRAVRLIRSNFLDIVVTFTTAFRVTGRYPQLRSPASALFLGWSEKSELSDGTFRPLVSRVGGLVDM